MNKNKLGFIIGTTAMVANLGFSSMLIANASDRIEDCTSTYGIEMTSVNDTVDFYTSTYSSFNNPIESSATTTVVGLIDIEVKICSASYSAATFTILAQDFFDQDYNNSIPVSNLRIIDNNWLTRLRCIQPWNCSREEVPNSLSGSTYFTDIFTPITVFSITASGTSTIAGEYAEGTYEAQLVLSLDIPPDQPPGIYTSAFTLESLLTNTPL